MWSVGCIFAELLDGKPLFSGKDEIFRLVSCFVKELFLTARTNFNLSALQHYDACTMLFPPFNMPEQISKIFELCGAPDDSNWPGVTKLPWYSNFKPNRPLKKRLRDHFRLLDRHALELLEKMLILDPAQRISTRDALDAEYFWTDPLPCDPKSLPKYESSHEYQTKQKRQKQRQHEEAAKRQKLQHPPLYTRAPIQSGQAHGQMQAGPNQPMHGSQHSVPSGPGHHGKPRGPSRYAQGGNPSGGRNRPNRGNQGGDRGYGSGPYMQHGRGQGYGPSSMPVAGPRGGASGGYDGGRNYQQGGPYDGSGAGRGSNMMGRKHNQPHGWQQ
uniref:Protein kinase domain-containing protein n=1 Tax=Chenopodium quinoa TaxID=63459 RepID=A0A803L403_CHEQI